MKLVLKVLLLWMLAIAIPFQGFASAAMLSCEQVPAGHAPVQVQDTGAHDHCAEPEKSQPDESKSSHGCAAAGCAAAVVSAQMPDVPAQQNGAPVPSATSFIPDAEQGTLDRPPRLS